MTSMKAVFKFTSEIYLMVQPQYFLLKSDRIWKTIVKIYLSSETGAPYGPSLSPVPKKTLQNF